MGEAPPSASCSYGVNGLQTALSAPSASGIMMAEKVNPGMPVLRSWLYGSRGGPLIRRDALSVVGGALLSVTVVLLTNGCFPATSELAQMKVTVEGALTMFYGGIFEEIVMRLFFMTFLV